MASDAAARESAAVLRRKPLTFAAKALYGVGTIPDAVTATLLATFLFFYLTAVCGLPNSLAGISLFVALTVDALADPLVGSISDNSWSRIGRRHPFMFLGPFPLALGMGLLFSVPHGLKDWWLFAYVTAISIMLRVSHSIFFLPYVGLGAELSDDYTERTNIVASRFTFSVAGTASCLALGFLVFLHGGKAGLLHRDAYAPFAWCCGAIALASALVAAFGTLPALARLHRVAPATGSIGGRFLRDMKEIFGNPSFVFLFLSLLLLFTGAGTAATIALHLNAFFWKMPGAVITATQLAAPVGVLIGVPVSVFLSNKFEKRSVVIACFATLIAYHALVAPLRIVGVLPPGGTVLWAILIGLAVVIGAVVGCAGIGFQSMLADTADEHEFLFGTRREGLYFAGLNFSAKAASGLGALVAGVTLDLIRFPTNIAAHGGAAIVIPQATLTRLGLLYGPGVALIYAAATLVFLLYRLDRPKYARIQEALEERRQQALVAAAVTLEVAP